MVKLFVTVAAILLTCTMIFHARLVPSLNSYLTQKPGADRFCHVNAV